jgi:hypothetical protein
MKLGKTVAGFEKALNHCWKNCESDHDAIGARQRSRVLDEFLVIVLLPMYVIRQLNLDSTPTSQYASRAQSGAF